MVGTNNRTMVAFTVLKIPNAMEIQCQAASDQVLVEVHVILKQLVALVCSR